MALNFTLICCIILFFFRERMRFSSFFFFYRQTEHFMFIEYKLSLIVMLQGHLYLLNCPTGIRTVVKADIEQQASQTPPAALGRLL